jgi:hypothetical protein
MSEQSVKLDDGKYEFYLNDAGRLLCERYGEPWREFVGDKSSELATHCRMTLDDSSAHSR